jgi:hypothetical protein
MKGVAPVLGETGATGGCVPVLIGGLVPDNPNSEINLAKVVLWCIVPKCRVQGPGTPALSITFPTLS